MAAAYGALFGLVVYGVYDFTNYSTLRQWPSPALVTWVPRCCRCSGTGRPTCHNNGGQARKVHGDRLTVVRAEFAHNDRAQAENKTKGLIKVMVVKGRPVGAGIVGPQAGELIGFWALAISARLKLSAVAGMVAPYPTLGEVSKRAASTYFSPKLFGSPAVKRIVRLVQRLIP